MPLAAGGVAARGLGTLGGGAEDTAKGVGAVLLHCDQPAGKVPGTVVSNDSRVPTGPAGVKRGSSSSSRRPGGRKPLCFVMFSLQEVTHCWGEIGCCAVFSPSVVPGKGEAIAPSRTGSILGHLPGSRQPGLSDRPPERVRLSAYNHSSRKQPTGWDREGITVETVPPLTSSEGAGRPLR